MNIWDGFNNFQKNCVQADSLEEFLERYTKHDRHGGRGSEYVKSRIQSHQDHLDRYGYTIITRHDSVTGEVVSYYR